MGLSTECPLLFSQVQSPGNGAYLVVLSALISGVAGAAAGAGATATGAAGVTEVLEVPLAFSSASSCAIRAFISVSSLMTASLLGGVALALGGVVVLSGVEVALWA
jgi:hypothetical protein